MPPRSPAIPVLPKAANRRRGRGDRSTVESRRERAARSARGRAKQNRRRARPAAATVRPHRLAIVDRDGPAASRLIQRQPETVSRLEAAALRPRKPSARLPFLPAQGRSARPSVEPDRTHRPRPPPGRAGGTEPGRRRQEPVDLPRPILPPRSGRTGGPRGRESLHLGRRRPSSARPRPTGGEIGRARIADDEFPAAGAEADPLDW